MSFIFRESANAKNHGATEHAGDEMLFTHSELPTAPVIEVQGGSKSMWHGGQKKSPQ